MKREVLTTPNIPPSGSHYNMVTKAGPFLFLAGITGRHPDTNKVCQGLDDLPEDVAKELSSGDRHEDAHLGPTMAQTWGVYTTMKRILEGAGSSLDNLLQATVYLTDMKNFPAFNQVRRRFLKSPPPSTVVEVCRLGAYSNSLVEVTVIALIPDKD